MLTARPDSILNQASQKSALPTAVKRRRIPLDEILAQLAPGPGRRIGAIRRLVAQLLRDVETVPTPLNVIAERLGVDALAQGDVCGAGRLEEENGFWRVVVSQADSSARQRFTTAHELGHVQLLALPGFAPRGGRELEQSCNRFASELLMPAAPFRDVIGDAANLEAIGEAARAFHVSFSAAAIRAQEIWSATVIFFVWNGVIDWGRGGIRRGGLVSLPPEIGQVVRADLDGTVHDDRVYAQLESHDGLWNIACQECGDGARLFLMTPILQGPGR